MKARWNIKLIDPMIRLVSQHRGKAATALSVIAVVVVAAPFLMRADGPASLPRPTGADPIVFSVPDGALPPEAPRTTVPSHNPAFEAAPSATLERVRSEAGVLSAKFKTHRLCQGEDCLDAIIFVDTGEVVFDGETWREGYIPTGQGLEVLRTRLSR